MSTTELVALRFPQGSVLELVLRSGAIAQEIAGRAVRYRREAKGALLLALDEPLPETALDRVISAGVTTVEASASDEWSVGLCWAATMPPCYVGEPVEIPAKVFFWAPRSAQDPTECDRAVMRLASDVLRLGCDRQRFEISSDGALLETIGPPYYAVARACDGKSLITAYLAAESDRTLVELGYRHALTNSRLTIPDGHRLFIRGQGTWTLLPMVAARDLYEVLTITAPVSTRVEPRTLDAPIQVSLRLARRGSPRPASLWVLRDRALDQLEHLARSLPTESAAKVDFAAGRIDARLHSEDSVRPTEDIDASQTDLETADGDTNAQDAAPVVVLRARPGAHQELALRAEAYAPHPQLPALFLPVDQDLEPPLAPARLKQALELGDDDLVWVHALQDGSIRTERASHRSFACLAEWTAYVIHTHAPRLAPWVRASTFDLDDFVVAEPVFAQNDDGKDQDQEQPADTTNETDAAADPSPGRNRPKRKPPASNQRSPEEPADSGTQAPVSRPGVDPVIASRARELEQRFLQLGPIGWTTQHSETMVALGVDYAQMGRPGDAGLCFGRVLWEERAGRWHDDSLTCWMQAELCNPERLRAVLHGTAPPAQETVRAMSAALLAGGASAIEADPTVWSVFFDRHDACLDVRLRWLTRLTISRQVGTDVLGLTRVRDRILSDLRTGLALDRDVPTFLRQHAARPREDAVTDRLVHSLEELDRNLDNKNRKRATMEAPLAVTRAYTGHIIAWGFARLGQAARARDLVKAYAQGADPKDPIHHFALRALGARVLQAIDGLPPTTPLDAGITAELNELEKFARYKVDRLREVSEILEPVERLDAVVGFQRGERDPRGEVLAPLRGLSDPAALLESVDQVVQAACDTTTPAEVRARHFDGVMDFFHGLPASEVPRLLETIVHNLDGIDPLYRVLLLEEALMLAGLFGHEALISQIAPELRQLLAEVAGDQLARIGKAFRGALRTLRRVGLRDEAISLLDVVSNVELTVDPTQIVARLHAAGGYSYLGQPKTAIEIAQHALAVLRPDLAIAPRLAIVRALCQTAALLPIDPSMEILGAVGQQLLFVTDGYSTNSHFCLSLVHFVESLVLGHARTEIGFDEVGREWLDEDESRVRRRIHRDLEEARSH